MPFDFSTDDDRAEWDRIWRNRPLRQLVNPVQIDVAPSPDHEFGELTRVDVAADPPQFADRGNRATETCPVCGVTTSPELRIAVSICLTSRFPILLWWGPKRDARSVSSVAATRSGRRSYSASSRMNARISGTSFSVASSMRREACSAIFDPLKLLDSLRLDAGLVPPV